jgi:lysozyme
MRLSDKGVVEIAEHEGIVPAPYRDSVGVVTYGVGHTAAAGGLDPREMSSAMPTGDALTAAVDRAILLFRDDLEKYEERVNSEFKVPLKQHEFDALVSWDFNTGGATWRHKRTGKPCQLHQQVNAGDKSGAGFMGWLKPPEIRKRRTAEMNLFKTGDYDANGNTVPIWGTNGALHLTGIVGHVSGPSLIARMGRGSVSEPSSTGFDWGWLIKLIMGMFKK